MVSIKPRPAPPLDYAKWGVLENKTNETSLLNIGSLKTAIKEECKKFRRPADTMIEKKKTAILSKFTVLCLSYLILNF